jgi:cyclopropane-fatty-acyl-phospholipid synthase
MRRKLRIGNLTVHFENGTSETYGDGTGRPVVARITDKAAAAITLFPGLHLGESYMDGGLSLDEGTLWDLIDIIGRNLQGKRLGAQGPVADALRSVRIRLQQWNDRNASQRNVAHHYDLSYELYRRFLDEDMQYSCAYFARPDMTLEEAQAAKKAHIAAKLRLSPGQRVLDIGCGWGGLGLELAGKHGVKVLGVTLSKEQLAIAQRRAKDAGLEHLAEFRLIDYRDVEGPFDRIVSVGMFEHVGVPNYRTYFDSVRRLLKPDGVALIHSIGRHLGPGMTQAWIQKYIFPGGYIPALSEVVPYAEKADLWITDLEILRLHYAETLRHWRERFMASWDDMAELYDERFCRMWEFYLGFSELAFRYMGHMVFQMQLTRRVEALPITRDYMYEAEHAPEQASRPQPARKMERLRGEVA